MQIFDNLKHVQQTILVLCLRANNTKNGTNIVSRTNAESRKFFKQKVFLIKKFSTVWIFGAKMKMESSHHTL